MKLANLSVDLGHNADSSNKSTGPGRIGDFRNDISKLSESEPSLVLTEKSLLKVIVVDSFSSTASCESSFVQFRHFPLHDVEKDIVDKLRYFPKIPAISYQFSITLTYFQFISIFVI